MHLKIHTLYFASICVLATLLYYSYFRYFNNFTAHNELNYSNDLVLNKTKYVLYWIPFWQRKDYFLGTGFKPFKNCKYNNCYATDDKNFLPIEKYDALLFHGIREINQMPIPPVRKPHQYYIYMNMEAPVHMCPNLKPYNSFYNLTMTYRFDSDIVRRHGFVTKLKSNYILPSTDYINNKTKLAAWFVSDCQTASKREVLVKKIQKYMPVDIYGRCGNLKCKSNGKVSSEECYDMVERDYKFYFSFENSYCKDYSTEKMYKILNRNIVPVVYGAGDYELSAPPNSVINVADFNNVTELVNYLRFLDSNNEKYLEYFNWKKDFSVTGSDGAACEICRRVNEQKHFVSDDIVTWWWGIKKSMCKIGKNLPKIVSNLL